ncbi:MAG: WD40/YVTN/BNR-like repeat-containing protein [Gemmatimonadaceae bacterium]
MAKALLATPPGAAGGIAKTTNGGTTFTQIFDTQNVQSVGAIAIASSDPNVLYVGTGEGNPRNSASFGGASDIGSTRDCARSSTRSPGR